MPLFRKHGRALLKQRPQLSHDEFYRAYYESKGVPRHVIQRLLHCFETVTGYSMTGVLPSDRIVYDLLDESDSMSDVELITALEAEFSFDVMSHEAAEVGTFDDLVQMIQKILSSQKR